GAVYAKSAGSWNDTGRSLRGPTGATGATGSTGAAGAAGAKGDTGATGPAGAAILAGSGAPSSGLGKDGDSYVNLSTGAVYGRTGGVWSDTGTSLRGPTGATGAAGAAGAKGDTGATGATGATGTPGVSILTGSGTPSNSVGNNGDSYVNLANGAVWAKSAGAWSDT